jgi:hypothetical protein
VVVHYLVVGGAGVSSKVVRWTMPTAGGNRAVTGVGFRPDLVLHMHGGFGLAGAPPYDATRSAVALGAMNAQGEQWASAAGADDGPDTTATIRVQRTDAALVLVGEYLALDQRASYVSMDPDGFTLAFSDAAGQQAVSLALDGVSSKIGAFAKRSGTGAQPVGSVGFAPSAVVLASFDRTAAAAAVYEDAHFVLGASDGLAEASAALVDRTGLDWSFVRGLDLTSKVFASVSAGGVVEDAADLATLDPDGFTLQWSSSDATASQILYLALGSP